MEPQQVSATQKWVCPNLAVTSNLGQALCREGYSADGDFLDKDKALAWAINKEKIELIKAIVEDGVNIDLGTDPSQNAAIHIAAFVGSCEITSILKDAGASLEGRTVTGGTPLHIAAHCGRFEVAKLLCDLGVDTNSRCDGGSPPIHYAAKAGHCETIQLLLDRNVDVDFRDDEGMTTLSIASQNGRIGAVQLLVKRGASINFRDKYGNTPMHYAAEHDHVEIMKYFIELGGDLTSSNKYRCNVLSKAALGKARDVVNLIVQLEGVDVNQQDRYSVIVPLMSAAMSGSLEIARLLVENGALLEVTDNRGNTPLHAASLRGHIEIARFLLEKGANIESRNNNQKTPFILAALEGNIGVVRLLAEYGANREAKDSNGRCALHYAALSENNLLLRCLLELGVDIEVEFPSGSTVLEFANAKGWEGIVSSTLEFGASTIAKEKEKGTISRRSPNDQLIACARHGNMTQMTRFLDEGVDINVLSTSGRSALSVAAEHGHQHLVNLILERGALLDLQDSNGETALWWASQCNHIGVVQRLLDLGAQVDLSDSDGNSPLCVACQTDHVDIAERLLEAGGDPTTTTNYGMTPLLLAANANHMKVVDLLIDKGVSTVDQIAETVKSGGIGPNSVANITRYLCDRYGRDHVKDYLDLDDDLDEFNENFPPQQDETNSADDFDDPTYAKQLISAACDGLVPEMIRLIKAGANINGTDGKAVPLISAARNAQERVVQALIESGAQVDKVDESGMTALCVAAHRGNNAIIDLLCSHNANIGHKDARGVTPLNRAVFSGHADAVEILLDRGAKIDDNPVNSLDVAVMGGSEPVIEILVRKGAKVRDVNEIGYTPLLCAVNRGKWSIAETLLKTGAGHDFVPGSKHSPMFEAISSGQAAMVELLAKYGADINHLEETDQTPLIVAAQLGKDIVVQSLIDMGADLDGRDDNGRTALSYAKENGRKSTLKLLLQAQTLRRDSQYVEKAEEQRKNPKTTFEYRPILEGFIRVLVLEPGQKGNIICFSLVHVKLSRSPSFEALSYEWQGKEGTVPTRCDGERILITPNCYAALEALRSETRTRTLWIDAICINQQDNTERGIQVSMMSEIYSKATSVLIWIGEEESNSDLAFDSVPVLSRAFEEVKMSPESALTPPDVIHMDILLGLPEIQHFTRQEKASKTWMAWHTLYRRSYFTRAWIFQEIILAGPRGIVICGTRQCSWDAFNAALKTFRALQMENCEMLQTDQVDCLEAIMASDDNFRLQPILRLDDALGAMSSFKAGDPRDKVFAALGLAFGDGRDHQAWDSIPIPQADYTKSVEEVYMNVNRFIISRYGDYDLWHFLDPINTSTGTGDTKILPSWAYDFRKPRIRHRNPLTGDNAEYNYNILVCGRQMTTQTSLYVNGCVVDEVNCRVPITKDKSTMDVVKIVVRYMKGMRRGVYDPSPDIGKQGVQFCTREETENGFSTTNIAALLSTLMNLGGCSTDKTMKFVAYVVWQLMADNDISEILKAPPEFLQDEIEACERSSNEQADFDIAICNDMERRHHYYHDLIYTDKGYFGLALNGEVCEDLVVTIVGGCPDLVLLRRKSRDDDTWYEYVSKVYMNGWTTDKVKIVDDLGDDLEEVRFEIR
ncbi:hypothetical protein FSHL1_010234 [Fusarium sambucinum]